MLFCINFTRWKQKHISAFLSDKGEAIFITSAVDAAQKGFSENSQLITWASKDQTEVTKIASRVADETMSEQRDDYPKGGFVKTHKKWGGVPWYVEDGFIRSTGLGSDLTAPASIVLDKTGIYYDPNKPSDLESLLQNKQFSQVEFERADALKNSLLANELSKYNLGGEFKKTDLINYKPKQQIILIPGQVEDDASIKQGCVDINTNTALIKAVRDKNPDDFLIYKPHPDVVSGNRKGKIEQSITDVNCDLVLLDASITDCLAVVDEVHTMTSLVGFEALMRDLKVVCYGIPFYSGWGLTEDFHAVERRTRKLTLNELIHATLIDYPLYMDWETSTLTTPEVVVEQLNKQIEQQGGKQSNQVFWLIRFMRKVRNYIKGTLLSR